MRTGRVIKLITGSRRFLVLTFEKRKLTRIRDEGFRWQLIHRGPILAPSCLVPSAIFPQLATATDRLQQVSKFVCVYSPGDSRWESVRKLYDIVRNSFVSISDVRYTCVKRVELSERMCIVAFWTSALESSFHSYRTTFQTAVTCY